MPALDAFSLDGRRALVTGGNRGLGYAFTQALADCGAAVAFIARDPDANTTAIKRLAEEGRRVRDQRGSDDDADVRRGWSTRPPTRSAASTSLVNNAGTCFHNPAVGRHRRAVAAGLRPQRARGVEGQPGRRPAPARGRRGRDRQHRLDLRR